jgi:hypothetical protein
MRWRHKLIEALGDFRVWPQSRQAEGQPRCPLLSGGLNRSPQHFILEGKDGVWDGTEIS